MKENELAVAVAEKALLDVRLQESEEVSEQSIVYSCQKVQEKRNTVLRVHTFLPSGRPKIVWPGN